MGGSGRRPTRSRLFQRRHWHPEYDHRMGGSSEETHEFGCSEVSSSVPPQSNDVSSRGHHRVRHPVLWWSLLLVALCAVGFALLRGSNGGPRSILAGCLVVLPLVALGEIHFFRFLMRMRRDSSGMPPVEFASLRRPVGAPGVVCGRGVVVVDKMGGVESKFIVRVSLSADSLLLCPVGLPRITLPWYDIPVEAILSVEVTNERTMIKTKGHPLVTLIEYVGRELDGVLATHRATPASSIRFRS